MKRPLLLTIAGALAALAIVIAVFAAFQPASSPDTPPRRTSRGPCPPEEREADGKTCRTIKPQPQPKPSYSTYNWLVLDDTCNQRVLVEFTQVGHQLVTTVNCELKDLVISGKVKVEVQYCTDDKGGRILCTRDDQPRTTVWWEIAADQEHFLINVHIRTFAYSGVPGSVFLQSVPNK